jgi:signal transduction histidine kinase
MTDKKDIIAILKEVEIFSGFENDVLKEFTDEMKEVFLEEGKTLFKKGEKENAMYIIINGSVKIHDKDYIFTTLNSKQFFGEYTLIDSAVRSASVTAVKDTDLLELQQETFNKVTSKRPEIWKSVLITLIKRLRDYNIIEEKLTMRTIDIKKKKYKLEQEKEYIENKKKELESINTTKNKLFTILGNDLKNPFNTICDISTKIIDNKEVLSIDEISEYAKQINQYSKSSYKLLENLLLWARSQTGSLKVSFKRTNLKNTVDSIIEYFTVNAKQKNITLISSIADDIYGYFDSEMITTVIRNLISNALKYTNTNGKITVLAFEKDDMIQIEVSDTGVGISKDAQKDLFSIDRKRDENTSIIEGTGLGLVLIKEFITKNSGEIWVESELNSGTTFKFTIPKAL